MELIVAEKPKVAEKIATSLDEGAVKKSLGGISYYELEHEGKEIIVVSAVGHVYTLAEKKKSSKYPVFDIEWVPSFEASKEAAYTQPYVELIEKLGKKADLFIGACDYDIEGSLIAYNIFQYTTKIKQGARMKFSALTKNELISAYKNKTDFDYSNAVAGETRHIVDWYYGINLSRALMGAMRAASRYKVMSVGRVQGPALNMLTGLEEQIRAFVPTPYWEVSVIIKGIEFMHGAGRFDEENKADNALHSTTSEAIIKAIDKKEVEVPTLPNFDLTSLQVEAYRLFKYSPSQTLELAQNLYEGSLITYPRTSSQKIPPSIDVKKIIKDLSEGEYEKLAGQLLNKNWIKPFQGKKDDPAHPAIHPTGLVAKVSGPQKNLYDLIARRFLSSFAPAAKRERVRVDAESGGESYSASGSRLIEPGWTEYYGKYYTPEDVDLPKFTQNERVKVEDKKKEQKETKPPRRYTQASIISELEERHLGTKATRAGIIETLFKRGYAVSDPSIEVTDFGIKVCKVLQKYAGEILDEHLTRKIEEQMEEIQEGKTEKETVLKESREILTQLLDKWKTNERQIGTELLDALKVTQEHENNVGTCDKCGNQLRIIRMGAGRQFIGCHGYPNCRNAYPLPGGAQVKPLGKPCPTCSKPTVSVKRVVKGRRPIFFTMCIDPNCPSKDAWKKRKEEQAEQRQTAQSSEVKVTSDNPAVTEKPAIEKEDKPKAEIKKEKSEKPKRKSKKS